MWKQVLDKSAQVSQAYYQWCLDQYPRVEESITDHHPWKGICSQGKGEERLREWAANKEKNNGMKWEIIDNQVFK